MKIPASHIERIQQLGYTDSEARFPYIVAVFSGYFTMRQFRAFTGSRCGKRTACFAQKLIVQDHARVCAQARNASLFHLFSRTLYGQMDKGNLRKRKRHSVEFMRARLLLLDFILANLEFAYFETEPDRIDFFCNQLDISKDCLAAKRAKQGAVYFTSLLHPAQLHRQLHAFRGTSLDCPVRWKVAKKQTARAPDRARGGSDPLLGRAARHIPVGSLPPQ